jgi:hypothetical protein
MAFAINASALHQVLLFAAFAQPCSAIMLTVLSGVFFADRCSRIVFDVVGRSAALRATHPPTRPLNPTFSPLTGRQVCDAAATQSRAYARLEHLCVEFGHRLAGSATFDRCAAWACEQMRRDGLENVRMEAVPTEVRA